MACGTGGRIAPGMGHIPGGGGHAGTVRTSGGGGQGGGGQGGGQSRAMYGPGQRKGQLQTAAGTPNNSPRIAADRSERGMTGPSRGRSLISGVARSYTAFPQKL